MHIYALTHNVNVKIRLSLSYKFWLMDICIHTQASCVCVCFLLYCIVCASFCILRYLVFVIDLILSEALQLVYLLVMLRLCAVYLCAVCVCEHLHSSHPHSQFLLSFSATNFSTQMNIIQMLLFIIYNDELRSDPEYCPGTMKLVSQNLWLLASRCKLSTWLRVNCLLRLLDLNARTQLPMARGF